MRNLDTELWHILSGNIMLVVCCVFYLAWWIVAFHPSHAVKGPKSGWLLIPAAVFGIWAVVRIVQGCVTSDAEPLIARSAVLGGGIVVYVILLLITAMLLNRQVTTELLLIVGWTVVMFLEVSILYGMGLFRMGMTVAVLAVTVAAAVVSLVCYLLYYNLGAWSGYWDGMVPLVLVALMMIAVTVLTVLQNRPAALP